MNLRLACYGILIGLWPGLLGAQEVDRADGGVTAATMTVSPQINLPADFEGSAMAPWLSPMPVQRPEWSVPAMQWDGRHPRATRWSLAVMAALRGHGSDLLDVVPSDIEAWCPAYEAADRAQRAAFWAGLVSTLAWHESSHRPRAVGGGGRWFGLVQIAPGTARWRNCEVRTGQGLLDGAANLRCGIRIMAATVPRDGVVAEGMRGVAADWGPFHSRRKREEMRNWVRRQAYCRPPTRPVLRPAGLVPAPVLPQPRPARMTSAD
ncbi:transglycosylase SLT domain-containing protein [Rhodophyticola porphyridii]|nr:transglycosylase SLT domain-containing protein [Rhodophyticola porphyridii]